MSLPRYLRDREHIYHSVVAGLAVLVLNIARDDIWPQAFADGALVFLIVYLLPSFAAWMRRGSADSARLYNGLLDEADADDD